MATLITAMQVGCSLVFEKPNWKNAEALPKVRGRRQYRRGAYPRCVTYEPGKQYLTNTELSVFDEVHDWLLEDNPRFAGRFSRSMDSKIYLLIGFRFLETNDTNLNLSLFFRVSTVEINLTCSAQDRRLARLSSLL